MAAGLPGTGMTEKPESDEFEDEEADEPVTEEGDVDLDQVIKDLDLAKRRGQKVGDPAWRRSSPAISRTTRSAATTTPSNPKAGTSDICEAFSAQVQL